LVREVRRMETLKNFLLDSVRIYGSLLGVVRDGVE
jgi:hypothetical protein